MEEQRARQEEEARKATAASVADLSSTRIAEGTKFSNDTIDWAHFSSLTISCFDQGR